MKHLILPASFVGFTMRNFCLFTFIIVFIGSFSLYADDVFNREYLPLKKIQQKWGSKVKFDSTKFKGASSEIKATMVYDLIISKRYIKQPVDKVFADLGPSTGLFFSEMVPAYAIGNINEKPDELWQVVFLLTRDSKYIEKVVVHKKCCYK